ncbi:MAG TPA: tripartite tricarboxylate transporter substrate binding protein [Alphaproteobacteria bacterium]
MRRWLLATLLVMAGALPVGAQTTDQYPNRPVRFVVPFPPGGSYDVIARLLGRYISERWGQQIIVDNRSGAAGNIGSEYVARSKPDGYTLLVFGDGLLINQSLYSNPPYDSERDFDPITLAAISPQMLVANPGLGVKTIADLVALAKTRPGQINYGTAGAGTPGHLGGELLNRLAGIQLVHVPYRGGAQTMQDVVAGQIELVFTGMPATLGQIRADTVRPLGVSSRKRSPTLPDVPAIAETIPDFHVNTWYGVLAPKGTAREIITKVGDDVRTVLKLPALRDQLIEQGFEPVGGTAAELAATIHDDSPFWRDLIVRSGAHAE